MAHIPECSECHCPLEDLLMPVEHKEEVLPPSTLPSYEGIAALHSAALVTVLESDNNID
jgi:hypothetical protein